ncbi:MAG: hypothetical protein AVDCRST_MAG93-5695 [uncultured Chloroflexia bacterium]|uniref:Uncharacterized protein n=1 Tax=uncultured Chloroflexia bacterium TaxID=1672391 RepID=A0A6J4L1R8_9CHLR|nr:MAG: hypothetical protein AVDCRST_MAG93-5695 [uncultured Chloroflexia bacterium]
MVHSIVLASLRHRIAPELCNSKPGGGFLNPAIGFHGLSVGTSLCAKSPSHAIRGSGAILPDIAVDPDFPSAIIAEPPERNPVGASRRSSDQQPRNRKFTLVQLEAIQQRPHHTLRELAEEYGVSHETIRAARSRKTPGGRRTVSEEGRHFRMAQRTAFAMPAGNWSR